MIAISPAKTTLNSPLSLNGRDRDRSDHTGYTLVELLVVIALGSLILTAIPALAGGLLPSARFTAQVEDVKNTLEEARAKAYSAGKMVLVEVDDLGEGVRFEPDKLVSGSEDVIGFYGEGGATGGLVIVTNGSRERAIEVDWLTGRIADKEAEE